MKHILIVDDDADLVQTFKVRLEADGDFVVSTARNGEEALRVIQRGTPDLIVMDVLMPKMDGLTTLKAINKMTEKKVPVVIITGKATMTKDAFELEGACDFLEKPVDGSRLVKRIKEILV
jgi:DNA-binding NtrC family response regulator